MGYTRFPHGASSFGVPVVGGALLTTGKVFFVHNANGNDGNDGTDPAAPFKTLDYAVGKCTASEGDNIIVMEGSNESITSTIAVDVAGITILGLGNGQNRAMLTQATTGSDNVMEISAANVTLVNMYFKGSTTGTSETFINVQGVDNVTIRDCVFEQNTKNLIAIEVDTLTDYLIIDGCRFIGVGAGPDNAVRFHKLTTSAGLATILDPIIRNCLFNYTQSAGCDNGVILCSMSSGGVAGILIKDSQFIGLADGESAVNMKGFTDGIATGLMERVSVLSADATDVFVVSNMLGYIQVYATQAGARPFGSKAGSGMAPVLTAAA